ncbi:MAG: metal-sensing transcriptional repressor [Chloroflexota bacterium]
MTDAKAERQKKTIQRINRIQGQLNGLKTAIEEGRDCEYRVTQALTIEKAVSSLMQHMVGGYLDYEARQLMDEDPDEALRSIKRLVELSHR